MRGLLAACISLIRLKALLPVATDREPYHNSLAALVETSIDNELQRSWKDDERDHEPLRTGIGIF